MLRFILTLTPFLQNAMTQSICNFPLETQVAASRASFCQQSSGYDILHPRLYPDQNQLSVICTECADVLHTLTINAPHCILTPPQTLRQVYTMIWQACIEVVSGSIVLPPLRPYQSMYQQQNEPVDEPFPGTSKGSLYPTSISGLQERPPQFLLKQAPYPFGSSVSQWSRNGPEYGLNRPIRQPSQEPPYYNPLQPSVPPVNMPMFDPSAPPRHFLPRQSPPLYDIEHPQVMNPNGISMGSTSSISQSIPFSRPDEPVRTPLQTFTNTAPSYYPPRSSINQFPNILQSASSRPPIPPVLPTPDAYPRFPNVGAPPGFTGPTLASSPTITGSAFNSVPFGAQRSGSMLQFTGPSVQPSPKSFIPPQMMNGLQIPTMHGPLAPPTIPVSPVVAPRVAAMGSKNTMISQYPIAPPAPQTALPPPPISPSKSMSSIAQFPPGISPRQGSISQSIQPPRFDPTLMPSIKPTVSTIIQQSPLPFSQLSSNRTAAMPKSDDLRYGNNVASGRVPTSSIRATTPASEFKEPSSDEDDDDITTTSTRDNSGYNSPFVRYHSTGKNMTSNGAPYSFSSVSGLCTTLLALVISTSIL